MPLAPTHAGHLYYEQHGPAPGSAPAVVFAHGMGGSHLSWWQQVPYFRERYTCITFDHRGFGQSLEPPDGPGGAAFVEDLRLVLDHLQIERAHLVGQSMGGWTCLGFTVRHPERVARLVMCDTHGGLLDEAIAAAWKVDESVAAALPPGAHPGAGARMYQEQPALHFLYTQINDLNSPRTLAEMGAIIRAAGTVDPAGVATLDVPVLFIAGEEDIVIPPPVLALAAAHFKHARLERVRQSGHSVYFERPDLFNTIVDRFLSATD